MKQESKCYCVFYGTTRTSELCNHCYNETVMERLREFFNNGKPVTFRKKLRKLLIQIANKL